MLGLGLAVSATAWTTSRSLAASTEGAAGSASTTLEPSVRSAPPSGPLDVPFAALGPSFDDDTSLPAHAAPVHDTTLTARLDPVTHTVSGRTRIVWTNTARVAASEVWLHLYLNAFKNERTLFLRSRLGEGRGSRVPSDWGFIDIKRMELVAQRGGPEDVVGRDLWLTAERTSPGDAEDETDLRVPLPAPVAPGGEVTLEIDFEAKLPTITERTGYLGTFHMMAQWFPKLARHAADGSWEHFAFARLSEFSADFGHYHAVLDVPEGFLVGATGVRSSEEHKAGRVLSTWELGDAHDFAWTAWDQFEERTARLHGVDVRMLTPPGHAHAAALEMETVAQGLACLGRRYGKYPYPNLTVVHPPLGADEAGGMEYPTLITTGGAWHGWSPARPLESVTLHELGHQWFYGMVATDEHAAPFLDEGVNSYAEAMCLQERFGDGSIVDLPGLTISLEALHREGALWRGKDAAIGASSEGFPSASHYSALVYLRTSALLRSLAGAFGQDTVDRALGRYARAYRFQHPDARHLLDAFAQVAGEPARAALSAGLFDRGWVDYAAVELGSARHASPLGVFDKPGGRETITAATPSGDHDGWALIARQGSLRLPVDVELAFRDGSRRTVRWVGQADWVRIAWQRAPEIATVTVDPAHGIALDERHVNDARSLSPTYFARRSAERVTYVAELLTYLVGP